MKMKLLLLFLSFSYTLFAQEKGPNDPTRSAALECLAPFYHGVASGDPLSDRVILWTRVTTDSAAVDVTWRIATDTNMTNVIDSGMVNTDASKDYTVKADVTNLQPFTWYYYEFEAYGKYSVIGRTRTLPVGNNIDSLRFAVVSCQNYVNGYYNVFSELTAQNDVFAVIHLGDYIYEYGGGTAPRDHMPSTEILNLSDYRMRHSQYKLDEDLMRLHQQYPFIAVWDDHETANNSWFGGAENHDAGEGNWFDRKGYGVQAYYEWMPLRMPDMQDTQRIYRKFRFGDLIDLYMLDTRLEGREEQNGHDTDPNRTLLGQQQFDWFVNGIDTSTTKWQVMGQQVMMAPLNVNPTGFGGPVYANDDQWDGYPAERQKIWDTVLVNNINNFVVLTGDIHTSWANDLPANNYNGSTGAGSAGVEFVATSITSANSTFSIPNSTIQSVNPHIKFSNLTQHGCVILDINRNRTQGEFWFIDQISTRGGNLGFNQAWYVNDGERFLRSSNLPANPSASMIGIQAPYAPRNYDPSCNDTTVTQVQVFSKEQESVLMGVYPNPFNGEVALQFLLKEQSATQLRVYDALGSQVFESQLGNLDAGIHEEYIDLSAVGAGAYILVIQMGAKLSQRKLIKTE